MWPAVFLFFFATFLFLALDWMGEKFGRVSLDQLRFIYHSSLAGVDSAVARSFLGRLGLLLGLSAAFAALLLGLRRRPFWRRSGKIPLAATAIYCVLALAFAGQTLDLASLFKREDSPFIGHCYIPPDPAGIRFPERKRNLIIILAESAEHSFNDRALFGTPLMPELDDLARRHLSFRGHVQVPGTQWTIAGITSFLFGIPLRLPLFDWNDYSLFDTFLPGADSLLEVLSGQGYDIAMMLGSDAAFSGKKNLFAVHAPNASMLDLNYFRAVRRDVDAHQGTGWGLADSYVFDRAREFLDDRPADRPFFLLLETVDTHHPDPFIRPDFPRRHGDERDAFAAMSFTINEFVDWFSGHRLFADTTLVVLGDHLNMAGNVGAVRVEGARREIYNVFINSAGPEPEAGTERLFASFDLCPTILESVGALIPGGRFGLGASLYRALPTLLESNGAEVVIGELERFSPFYMDFYKARERTALAGESNAGVPETTGDSGTL